MNKVYIIAEAGVNHNGSVENAIKLIDCAVSAGADAIKFQTFKTECNITLNAPKAEYQINNCGTEETQFEMVKKLELTEEDHQMIFNYCKGKNIDFLSTPFDHWSLKLLLKLNINTIKIASGEINNVPLLREIGCLNKKIILSTGMANIGEIENAINLLCDNGTNRNNITLLHCNTEYPTPYVDVNLKAMTTMENTFKLNVGYSDHTLGIIVPVAAAAMGATIVEKHFTLDKNMKGPDHQASLSPEELKYMVESIRNIEKSLGDGIKKPSKSELKNIQIARRSIVAIKKIEKGEIFSENNIGLKRPAGGMSPIFWDEIIGKTAKQTFLTDQFIEI